MYGTVARMRIRPDSEQEFARIVNEIEGVKAPGQLAVYVYKMDSTPHEYYMAVLFESREAYHANARSPEQHQRFVKLMSVLEREPEWNDGEVVFAAI